MDPRLRGGDKKGLPFSSLSVIPPEHFFPMRGVLSAKAGIQSCHDVWTPASARTTEPTGRSQKGRQDISEMVGTLCVYYMVEEVLDHAAKEIT
jgi:hypothetical protein